MIALVSATLLTAVVVSTIAAQHVSARITEERSCEGPGKSCNSQGNAQESNPNVEEKCEAKNPAGHLPGGHNPC